MRQFLERSVVLFTELKIKVIIPIVGYRDGTEIVLPGASDPILQ